MVLNFVNEPAGELGEIDVRGIGRHCYSIESPRRE
jgi:hypothetical protein